jgi:putative PEP-CTERM system TPR-repeat lipoprotein
MAILQSYIYLSRIGTLSRLLVLLLLAACGGDNLTDSEHLQRAKAYQLAGEQRAAVIEFKNTLQKNPQNVEARLLLGEFYVLTGNGAGGEKELRRALQLGAESMQVMPFLGKALLLQQKYKVLLDEIQVSGSNEEQAVLLIFRGNANLGLQETQAALAEYRKAVGLVPNYPDALLGFTKVAIIQGEADKARSNLDKLINLDPNFLGAWQLKGRFEFSQGNYEPAEDAFRRVLEIDVAQNVQTLTKAALEAELGIIRVKIALNNTEQARTRLDLLLKENPRHPDPQYLYALLSYRDKNYKLAQDSLQEVLSIFPKHLPSSLLLGAVHFALGSYQQADSHLKQFVHEVPSHTQARKLLAATRLKLKRPNEAVAVLEPALKSSPDDAQLLAIIGRAALEGGKVDQATVYLEQALAAEPAAPSIRAELAKLYLQTGEFDQAIEELKRFPKSDEKKAKIMLVYAHLRKQDWDKARNIAKTLLVDSSQDPVMHTLLGGVEVASGNQNLARANFLKALQLQNDFTPARLNLARLALENDDMTAASEQFRQVLQTTPDNVQAMMGLAQIAERQGEREKAVSWLERGREIAPEVLSPKLILGRYYLRTGQSKKALEVAKEADNTHSEEPVVLLLLARSQAAVNDSETAVNTYQKLIKRVPKSAGAHLELAKLYLRLERYSQSESLLKKALQLESNFLPAQAELVRVYLHDNELNAALRLAKQIREKHSDSAIGYGLSGEVLMRMEDYRQAQIMFGKAYQKEPVSLGLLKLVMAHSQLQQYDKAIALLTNWLKENPEDYTLRMTRAELYLRTGDNDLAKSEMEKLIEQQPDNIIVLNNLAWLNYRQGDLDRAVIQARKAYDAVPDKGEIADTYGWILLQTNKDDALAVKILRAAAKKMPDNVEIKYHLATALIKTGEKTNEVKKYLEEITKSGQTFEGSHQVQRLLEEF